MSVNIQPPNLSSKEQNSSNYKPSPLNWRLELRSAFKALGPLAEYLELDLAENPHKLMIKKNFPLFVTKSFAARMQKKNWHDPLLMQVLPLASHKSKAFNQLDAVGDLASKAPGGLIHKYFSRALLISTGACAIHCQYCFRQHYPYQDDTQNSLADRLSAIKVYLDQHPEINELILSGGDPLMLDDKYLQAILNFVETQPTISVLRIHSRLPIVLPNRLTPVLLKMLDECSKQIYLVVHCNHPNELEDFSVVKFLRELQQSRVVTLNQSVLLAGINDTAQTQLQLCQRLSQIGVMPYYLHSIDKVPGSEAYEVSVSKGEKIIQSLQQQLPGYAVPRFAMDLPGNTSKTWIA